MRALNPILALLLLASVSMAEEPTPITPAEAAKKVNEMVLVQIEIKSTGGRSNHYLNSEKEFTDAKNFTIFIAKDHLELFKKAGVENPAQYYKGKVIQVSGKVVLEQQKPWIKVTDPAQIKLVPLEK